MQRIFVLVLALLTLPAAAQAGGKAEVFSAQTMRAQAARLVQPSRASGKSAGVTLGDYKTHALKLSVLTANGPVEAHAHYDDIMLVMSGQGTLITGGTIVGAHTGGDGETGGSGIRNGQPQTLSAGDIVHVPAGTPHQWRLSPGTTLSLFVVKVRE